MNLKDLRDKVAKLPPLPEDVPPHWDYWRADMRENLFNKHPSTFCEWPVIRHTMLMDHLPIDKSAEIVKHDLQRYAYSISEPKWLLSGGDGYGINNMYSRTMIEQCAHIAMWELHTGKRVETINHIVEFGGGFGAMALLVHRLGFTGKYVIFDFPEMTYLQEWWLEENGVTGIEFISDISDYHADTDLVIAIDSISESPMELRDTFLANVNMQSLVLRYSRQWENYYNHEYFQNLIETMGMKSFSWDAEGWVSTSLVGWR